MKVSRMFQTIDTHTAGQPTRTLVAGLGPVPGNSMEEKLLYMQTNADWLRTLLMCEPRGSNIMSGAILTEPCTPGTDIGVLYMEVGGWMPMCGHDTIGVGTALVESGIVKAEEPYTNVKLDTAAGVVSLRIKVRDHVAEAVTFTNAPAFVLLENATVKTEAFGTVSLDMCYGGNFYAIIRVEEVGLTLEKAQYKELIRAGVILRKAINEQLSIVHPEKPFIHECTHIEFIGAPENPKANYKNAVIFPPGDIDRSPCGTGTSARCALLVRQGKLKQGEVFVNESFIGSLFSCRMVGETAIGGISAVIPEVTGSAWLMGKSTFFLDPQDPFPEGFQVG